MTTKKVDWQLHVFGNTKHAFTNPQAHDTENGLIFSASAARRSTLLISNFLEEVLG
jgi:dienelactone hydrolase